MPFVRSFVKPSVEECSLKAEVDKPTVHLHMSPEDEDAVDQCREDFLRESGVPRHVRYREQHGKEAPERFVLSFGRSASGVRGFRGL